MAVQNSDIESVLFLISVQANVNSRVQDASKLTPLHLAVQAGSEIIVRNLVSGEEGSGWGAHVYLWWIRFNVWQN